VLFFILMILLLLIIVCPLSSTLALLFFSSLLLLSLLSLYKMNCIDLCNSFSIILPNLVLLSKYLVSHDVKWLDKLLMLLSVIDCFHSWNLLEYFLLISSNLVVLVKKNSIPIKFWSLGCILFSYLFWCAILIPVCFFRDLITLISIIAVFFWYSHQILQIWLVWMQIEFELLLNFKPMN